MLCGRIRRRRSADLQRTPACLILVLSIATVFVPLACGVQFQGPPAGAFLGRAGRYDYSPSALQTGNVQQFWWCGQARNPEKSSQDSDSIQYASTDLTTHQVTLPQTVLAETPGTWDAQFTCNPKVVRGTFTNPLADGQTYTYAMYYVATAYDNGESNAIGVAFSNDGIQWKKYPEPVIRPTAPTGYGAGQPAVYNSDHKSGIWLFFENAVGGPPEHFEATSTDGVHFSVVGKLTTDGIDSRVADGSWGDMAYDAKAGYWYALFNMALRPTLTTGGIVEPGQPGVLLYRIPAASLLTGAVPWQLLKTIDTNSTGHESVFIAALLRNDYGEVNVASYPTIQIYTSMSNPAPPWNASPASVGKSGRVDQWDIGTATWSPNDPRALLLSRYVNSSLSESTTGWVDPSGGFRSESILGKLYAAPQNGANLAFFGCKRDSIDYFLSVDPSCEGQRFLGVEGYGYAQPPAGASVVPLYSCATSRGHFATTDAHCEGRAASATLLGYALQK